VIEKLNDSNFLLYAMHHYDNPQCHSLEEFDEDRVVKEVAALFPQVKNYFADLTMKLANQMLSNDEEFSIRLRFD
jgi:flavorubredoxin